MASSSSAASSGSLIVTPDNGQFLCRLEIPHSLVKVEASLIRKPSFIIVLDTSGSMGQHVRDLVTKHLPSLLGQIGYTREDTITVIPFSNRSSCKTLQWTLPKMTSDRTLVAGGRTFMTPVVEQLARLFDAGEKRFRLLVISDGMLDDQTECLAATTTLAKNLALDPVLQINCQAVRYFTSQNQPDTRGLASFMQLNNTSTPSLMDMDAQRPNFRSLVDIFLNDGLCGQEIGLKFAAPIARRFPWSAQTANLAVTTGTNVFWTSVMPRTVTVRGLSVGTLDIVEEMAAPSAVMKVLEPTLQSLLERCKLLKVVNSDVSRDEVAEILKYAQSLEQNLQAGSATDLEELLRGGATARFAHLSNLVRKRKGNILTRIAEIANDDRVARLTAAQQADFLRQVSTTSTGKALARRAEKFGLDFASMVIDEIKAMTRHLSEIEDIDDSEHARSFYSQETTLDGIKAVCTLSVDELNEMEAIDILQIINIVGLGCRAAVGDFPDPMTWRVSSVYPGCYISNSDLLVGYLQTQGQMKLRPPGFPDGEITAVIPVFDDLRVQTFLQTHAPNILELYSSIGMRRVISGVPHTYMYTVCGGLWCLTQHVGVKEQRSSLAVRTLQLLLGTYRELCGTHWHRVLPAITSQPAHRNGNKKDLQLSYYIENNGLTNMIDPLHIIIAAGDVEYIPNILRAIYTFEVHQVMRKQVRHNLTANPKYVEELLHPLLSIDFDRHGVKLQPPFVADPRHYRWMSNWETNLDRLDELHKRFTHADEACLMPLFFAALVQDRLSDFADIPPVCDEFVHRMLGLAPDVSVVDFRTACIVQACLHLTKEQRVDTVKKQMKFVDLHTKRAIQHVVGDYVMEQYSNDYGVKLQAKKALEKNLTKERLVDELVKTSDIDVFSELLRDGLTIPISYPDQEPSSSSSSSSSPSPSSSSGCSARRSQSPTSQPTEFKHQIINTSSLGYAELDRRLTSTQETVPLRVKKLALLLTGLDKTGHPLWNGGNPIRVLDVDRYQQFFTGEKASTIWKRVLKRMRSATHQYRTIKANRHSHWNPKPSYFALGYPTMEKYFLSVSAETFLAYKQQHLTCCGLNKPPWSTGQITKEKLEQIEIQRKKEKRDRAERKRTLAKYKARAASSSTQGRGTRK